MTMARLDKNSARACRLVNILFVSTVTYSVFSIAVLLRLKTTVSSPTSFGINLSIALSLPTIAVTGVRCYLIVRRRSKVLQHVSPLNDSPKLEAACAAGVQWLALLWVVLASVNLLVAVRAPVCLSRPLPEWQDDLQGQSWKYGISCRLHRGFVALTILLALSITCLSYFDSIDKHRIRRGTSLISCYCNTRKPVKDHASLPSISSSHSWSTFGKEDPLYLIPERHSSQFEHEQWQRRRNSLSSQRAIYPRRYQWYDQRHRYASYGLPPSRYSSTLMSVSEGHSVEPRDQNSLIASSRSSNTWATIRSTRPSTMSSSRTRSSSNPERGDLRREKPSDSTSGKAAVLPDVLPLPTPPPPAWAPVLSHAPLSSDPTLRALSTGAATKPSLPHSKSSPDLQVQPLTAKKREASAPTISAVISASMENIEATAMKPTSPRKQMPTPMPTTPPPLPPPTLLAPPPPVAQAVPKIPTRAPGHSAKPSITRLTTSSSTATRPILAAKPSSQSNVQRPDPIRHRQHHQHYHSPHNGLGVSSQSQLQLPLQQYQHQRVWKHGHKYAQSQASRNPSIYSASSYGTHATDPRMSCETQASSANRHMRASVLSGRPGISGMQ